MEWYPLSAIAAALFNLTLAVVIYKKEHNKKANLLLANFLIALAVWCFGLFMVNIANSAEQGLLWARISHIGAIFIPAAFIHFIWQFSKSGKKNSIFVVVLAYLASAYLLLLLFDPDFISGVVTAKYISYAYEPGSKHSVMTIFFGLCFISGVYKLFTFYRDTEGYKKQQAKNFLFSLLFALLAIIAYFALSTTTVLITQIDNLLIIAFSGAFSYTMLTNRLADIRLILAKSILFLAYSFAVIASYTALSSASFWIFFRHAFEHSQYIPLFTATIPFTVFAILFPPFRKGIIGYIERVVYGRDYNYRQVIKETSEALVSILNLRELLGFINDTVSHNLKPKRLYLFLKDGHYFQVKACSGVASSNRKIAKENALIPFLETRRRAMSLWDIESNFAEETKIIAALKRMNAVIIVPLLANDRLTGFIVLDEKKSGKSYSPQDMEVLNAIATNAAIAVENAHLYQEAITDGLTGLYHHKYFQFRIKEELARSHRYHFPLAVIMLDIDFFKKINDRHGHQIGDQVLVELAVVVRKNIRLFDVFARYGGEEFALLLPAMGEESMQEHYKKVSLIANRLKKEIEKNKFSDNKINVTVSLGVAIFDGKDPQMTTAKLINQADMQLYKAKEAGRNRVFVTKVSTAGYLYEVS